MNRRACFEEHFSSVELSATMTSLGDRPRQCSTYQARKCSTSARSFGVIVFTVSKGNLPHSIPAAPLGPACPCFEDRGGNDYQRVIRMPPPSDSHILTISDTGCVRCPSGLDNNRLHRPLGTNSATTTVALEPAQEQTGRRRKSCLAGL